MPRSKGPNYFMDDRLVPRITQVTLIAERFACQDTQLK